MKTQVRELVLMRIIKNVGFVSVYQFLSCNGPNTSTDAVLSCEFRTETERNPRIEWKKKGKDVSYVYFDGEFTGEFRCCSSILVFQHLLVKYVLARLTVVLMLG